MPWNYPIGFNTLVHKAFLNIVQSLFGQLGTKQFCLVLAGGSICYWCQDSQLLSWAFKFFRSRQNPMTYWSLNPPFQTPNIHSLLFENTIRSVAEGFLCIVKPYKSGKPHPGMAGKSWGQSRLKFWRVDSVNLKYLYNVCCLGRGLSRTLPRPLNRQTDWDRYTPVGHVKAKLGLLEL
jgi:hypothetical protein